MLTDLLLAIVHHLLMFTLVAVLVIEIVTVRPGMAPAQLKRLGRLDGIYGGAAGLILVVGFCRVFFGAKPYDYYLTSSAFWAKIAAFAVVGALSAMPTLRFMQWARAAAIDAAFSPADTEVAKVRRLMHAEAVVFVLIPIFAAMMARGYGLW